MDTRQVMFIHGGEAFSDYAAFLTHLRTCELRNVLEEKPRRWKETLRTELGSGYEVYLPQMPNSQNAKYVEWKLWFSRYLALVRDGVILIGHSQGGYFLVKYLLEEEVPVRIGALLLVAAPAYPDDFGGEDGGDFRFNTALLSKLSNTASNIHIFHSIDDPVVPFAHAEAYMKAVPTATLHRCTSYGHFLTPEFPELLDVVRNN